MELKDVDPTDHEVHRPKVLEEFDRLNSRPMSAREEAAWDSLVDNFLAFASRETHTVPGLYAILSSQIVSAFTAFEALAKDLWFVAANASGAISPQQKEERRFDSIPNLKKSYKFAFPQARFVKTIFDDKEIKALAAVRNVIVHRSAVAQQFLDSVKSHPHLLNISVGMRLPLNGVMSAYLTNVAVESARKLLLEIDKRLRTCLQMYVLRARRRDMRLIIAM